MYKKTFFGLFVTLCFTVTAFAQTQFEAIQSAFKEYTNVEIIDIVVPTVIELPVDESPVESGEYVVIDESTGLTQPSFLKQTYSQSPEPVEIRTLDQTDYQNLSDGDRNTGKRFEVKSDQDNRVFIDFYTQKPITTSNIDFVFGQNVAYPTRIQVTSYDDQGNENIVYRESSFYSNELAFIPTTARHFRVNLVYVQPLQINEIVLSQDSVEQTVSRRLRFLMQPDTPYRVYRKADRYVPITYGVSGDLMKDEGVRTLLRPIWNSNTAYKRADTDTDGIFDLRDNCVTVSNPDQADIDMNGKGDACDDYDRDGYLTGEDNCEYIPNFQHDEDGDGIGDECDTEESRLTERLPWVPWVGMGIAVLVLLGLFAIVVRDMKKKESITTEGQES